MSRHHAWVFVINNYTTLDEFGVKHLISKGNVAYVIVGKEVAPTTGTRHLQGYIRFDESTSYSLAVMKKSLPRAKLIVATGGDLANQKYCSKENIWIEQGEPSQQGKRTDILELSQKIKNQEITLIDVMFDYPILYLKYSRSLEKMFDAISKPRTSPPEVYWRWGLTGVGKTKYCMDKHPDHYVKDNTMWWDKYKQNEAVIIDDFDNSIPFRVLLRILDRYVMPVQVKGGYTHLNSPYIYITCEFPPEYFWEGNALAQVMRRITSVEEIK